MLSQSYKTWVFDCDGVLLDSNKVKSEAFYQVALPYGVEIAKKFVNYHQQHGGVSRFRKIEALWVDLLGLPKDQEQIDRLVGEYAGICRHGMLSCNETPKTRDFLSRVSNCKRLVVSGGEQEELRQIFSNRELDKYFDGIYGSPSSKSEILDSLRLEKPGIFVGDSKCDYESACGANLDFIFMTQFTEFDGWNRYFVDKDVTIISNLGDL